MFIKEKLMIEKILNEIHRLKEELDGYSASEGLDYIESYINILQQSVPSNLKVKEADLEKEMSKYLGDDWKKDADGEIESEMMAFAKHFFELGLKSQQGIKSED